MPIIKKKKVEKKIPTNLRLEPELLKKISQISKDTGESKTYVIESLLNYAIEAYEKERKSKK